MSTKINKTYQVNFDSKLVMSSDAGLVLLRKLMNNTGLLNMLKTRFIGRRNGKQYDYLSIIVSMLIGLSKGNRGLSCTKGLAEDIGLQRITGLKKVPSEPTIHRAMDELANIMYRTMKDSYHKVNVKENTNLFSSTWNPQRKKHKRFVSNTIKYADREVLKDFAYILEKLSIRLLESSKHQSLYFKNHVPVFIDGTNLEVTGNCFEGAKTDYKHNTSLAWQTMWIGDYLVSQELREGGTYEMSGIDKFIDAADNVKTSINAFSNRSFLYLMDSAYGLEEHLYKRIEAGDDYYIIGANKLRVPLTNLVKDTSIEYWEHIGTDRNRGYSDVWMREFFYQAENWDTKRKVIACKYIKEGELTENHTFLWTNIKKQDLDKQMKTSSFLQMIWQMYSYKQSKENLFKTPLRDLNLHHPVSGYFAKDQIFYAIASLAVNLNIAIGRILLHKQERNMRLYRIRELYFNVPAVITSHANRVVISFSKWVPVHRKKLWLHAYNNLKYI